MAIDYKKFGLYVKEKRREMGYSQKEVYELTGVSIETQRLLENGYREPRIITLERLSELYKVDFILILHHSRRASDFFSVDLLEEMTRHFNERDYDGFMASLEQLIATIRQEYLNDGHKTSQNMRFLSTLEKLKDVRLEEHRYNMSSAIFYEQLLSFFSRDKIHPLSDSHHYLLEIQVGIILSVIYRQRDEFDKSMNILEKLITYFDNEEYLSQRQMDYLIVCYINLCHVYHRLDQHNKIIVTINTIMQKDRLRFKRVYINELLFRLAIAYYKSGRTNYKSIITNILLTESPSRALEIYSRLKKNYGIDAAEFMDMDDVAGYETWHDELA